MIISNERLQELIKEYTFLAGNQYMPKNVQFAHRTILSALLELQASRKA